MTKIKILRMPDSVFLLKMTVDYGGICNFGIVKYQKINGLGVIKQGMT